MKTKHFVFIAALMLAFSIPAAAAELEIGTGFSSNSHDASVSIGSVWNIGGTDYRAGAQYLGYINLGNRALATGTLNNLQETYLGNSSVFELYATVNPVIYGGEHFTLGGEFGFSAFKDKTVSAKLASSLIYGAYISAGNGWSISLTTRSMYSFGGTVPGSINPVKYNLSMRKKF